MRKDTPKVLFVEDDEEIQQDWQEELGGTVECIGAASIEEAEAQFAANPDIVAVVVDGCVPGDVLNTLPLVREFRNTFEGPMIAVSSDPDYRERLVEAGCSHESKKADLPVTLLEVLGIS